MYNSSLTWSIPISKHSKLESDGYVWGITHFKETLSVHIGSVIENGHGYHRILLLNMWCSNMYLGLGGGISSHLSMANCSLNFLTSIIILGGFVCFKKANSEFPRLLYIKHWNMTINNLGMSNQNFSIQTKVLGALHVVSINTCSIKAHSLPNLNTFHRCCICSNYKLWNCMHIQYECEEYSPK